MGAGDQGRRWEGGGYLSRYEFEQAIKRVDGRLDSQDGELTKIRERLHSIANSIAEIQVMKLQIDRIEQAVTERKNGIRWWVVLLVGIGMPFVMLVMQIIAKKLGLL